MLPNFLSAIVLIMSTWSRVVWVSQLAKEGPPVEPQMFCVGISDAEAKKWVVIELDKPSTFNEKTNRFTNPFIVVKEASGAETNKRPGNGNRVTNTCEPAAETGATVVAHLKAGETADWLVEAKWAVGRKFTVEEDDGTEYAVTGKSISITVIEAKFPFKMDVGGKGVRALLQV